MFDLADRSVLITGGSRGIGASISQAFAEQGARVAVSFKSDAASAHAMIAGLAGSGHVAIQGDVSDPAFVPSLIDQTVDQLGGLDVVINNAGTFEAHPIDEVSYEAWQQTWHRVVDLNLHAAANVCFIAAQHMMKAGGGNIVNISSRGAFRGEPESPAYGATKAGLNALTQSLAQKLAPYGICVGAVAPGMVNAGMALPKLSSPQGDALRAQSPFGRVAEPEEVAYAAMFLASRKAIFSSGAIIDVNGASYLRS